MRYILLAIGIILFAQNCECKDVDSYTWINLMKELNTAINGCKSSRTAASIWHCLKAFSLRKLDEIMSADIIPLLDGVELVRFPTNPAGGRLANSSNNKSKSFSQNVTNATWSYLVLDKFSDMLSTHVLQIGINDWASGVQVSTARHRRHRNHMMVAMVFGVTALGSVMVPLGFQFLAVVAGKALLLAKLALALASINGLKRVATSGVHYGLYQVPEHTGYGYYDRGDIQHPRTSS